VHYLNRKQATSYLREKGIPCGDNFLAHQAVDGTGPQFRYSGRHPIYVEEDLDDWIESRLTAPVRSPTEATLLSENKKPFNPPLGPPTREAKHQTAAPTTPRRPGRPRQKELAQAEPDAA
jgi:hypothetical protein